MKKIISTLLAVAMMLTLLVACNSNPEETTTPKTTTDQTTPVATGVTVKIATLQGPTGMGMSYLLKDAKNTATLNTYEAEVCSSPDEITGRIVSGKLDMAALPTNAAATLYNKSNGKIKILAVNTGCVLYVLEKGDTIKDIKDLKGKTVYVSGQGSTPEYILNYLLSANGLEAGKDVTLDFTYNVHNDLVAAAAAGKADVVVLPEPAVTALLAQDEDMHVAFSFADAWNAATKGTENEGAAVDMGCVVVNTAFADAHPDAVEAFLYEYKNSIDKVNDESLIDETAQTIADVGIVAKAGVAKMALPRCNIIFKTGDEMKTELIGFYKVLFDAQPNSVGGKLPNDDFYYGAKKAQ